MTQQECQELDAWIAEHVMGTKEMFGLKKRGYYYRPNACGYTDRQSEAWRLTLAEAKKHEYLYGDFDDRVTVCSIDIPRYSFDPDAALSVLKRCCEKVGPNPLFSICIREREDGFWEVFNDSVNNSAPTLELAICLFAQQLFSK